MFWMIVVWVHITTAMFWIGGMLFFVLVLVPSLREVSFEQRMDLMSKIGKRFRTSGSISLGVLILTGLLNLYHRGIPIRNDGNAMRIKLFLILMMILLTLLHDWVLGPLSIQISRSTNGPRLAQKITRWLARVNLLVGLSIVLAAVYSARGY